MHVEALTLFPRATLQPWLVVSPPSSRSAASAARPRVRLMRRLPWWASMTAIRPCHFASALSWAITAAPHRGNRPATRSESLFPSSHYSVFSVQSLFFLFFNYSSPLMLRSDWANLVPIGFLLKSNFRADYPHCVKMGWSSVHNRPHYSLIWQVAVATMSKRRHRPAYCVMSHHCDTQQQHK